MQEFFLGESDISEDLFEELVDLVKCRYGGAIGIENSYSKLGLSYEDGPLELDWIKNNLPVNLSIVDSPKGFHSVLVEYVKQERTGGIWADLTNGTHGTSSHFVDVLGLANSGGIYRSKPPIQEQISWKSLQLYFPTYDHQKRCRSFRLLKY